MNQTFAQLLPLQFQHSFSLMDTVSIIVMVVMMIIVMVVMMMFIEASKSIDVWRCNRRWGWRRGGGGEVWQLFLDWPLLLPFTQQSTPNHLNLPFPSFHLWSHACHCIALDWTVSTKVLHSFWFGPILIILVGSVLWNCLWNFWNKICTIFHLLFSSICLLHLFVPMATARSDDKSAVKNYTTLKVYFHVGTLWNMFWWS